MSIVSMYSDLHPYACGQNCIHCRKAVEGDHNPITCAMCRPELEDVVPPELQLNDGYIGDDLPSGLNPGISNPDFEHSFDSYRED